jgi:hypothetical protein
MIRSIASATVSAAGIALLGMVLLFVVNFVVVGVPPEHYRRVVDEAVKSGTLAMVVPLPFAPAKTFYPRAGNDCLILGMLAVPRDSRIKASVSPRMPVWGNHPDMTEPAGYPPGSHCLLLAATMKTLSEIPDEQVERGYYHRYIHGDLTFAALLLAVTSLGGASAFMLGACYAGLGILAVLALTRLRSHEATERRRAAGFLMISVTLAGFYGLPYFAPSFSFAPTDLVIIGFLAFGLLHPLGRLTERCFIVAVAVFATLIAMLEFLTGGIPAGVAALVMLIGLGNAPDTAALVRRLIIGLSVFAAAVIACFALKLLAVWALWGSSEAADFVQLLGHRMGGSVGADLPDRLREGFRSYGIDPDWVDANYFTRALFAAVMLIYSSFVLAWGSHVVGAIVVVIPTAGLLWFAYRIMRGRYRPEGASAQLMLTAAGMVPILWYLVFANHTIVHSLYMVRPLALNLALFLIVGGASERLARLASPTEGASP